MSRCEHGEVISVFCVKENCKWRDAGGCPQCLKKYHSHSLETETISIQKLEGLFSQLLVKPEIRPKCRILQEAIYNYFIIMKSQLSSSLDVVAREISNRLGYPYLSQEGQLTVFKKIKNREYKKINKNELMSFYGFASQAHKPKIQKVEEQLYYKEIESSQKVLDEINKSFANYSQAVLKLDASFNADNTFFQKIKEVVKGIQGGKPEHFDKSHGKIGENSKSALAKQQTGSSSKKSQNNRDRRVSLEIRGELTGELNKWNRVNYDQNEKQIEARKKRLMEMINNTANPQDLSEFKVEIKDEKSKGPNSRKSLLQKTPDPKHHARNSSIGPPKNSNSLEKNDPAALFAHYIENGINIPQMIAHTILPREASRQKLYEDTKDVKEMTIKVSVRNYDEGFEEISSPLLKKRRQKKEEGQLQLRQVPSSEEKNLDNEKSPVKDAQEESQQSQEKTMDSDAEITEAQANSLALLVQSLPLSAEQAIPLLEAALKYSASNLSAAEYLSYLYLDVEKPKQCLDLCNRTLEQLRGSPEAQQLSVHIDNNRAAALNILGRYSQSIAILQKCLLLQEKDIYFKNLGDSYFSIGIHQKAIFNYEKAVQLNRESDEALYNLAVCYFMQGNINESKLNVENALKVNPDNQSYQELYRQILLKIQL